jgi:predicted metal-dependent enzyme (double-stranded beta helix superfamily)
MSAAVDAAVSALREAARQGEPALVSALRRLVRRPDAWERVFHGVEDADDRGVAVLHVDDAVTLVHVDLAPGFRSRAHSHGLRAAIGVYAGREDNTLYAADGSAGLRVSGRVAVGPGEVFGMGADAIHHIENPLDVQLRAVHVYFGDLRHAWRHRYEPPGWAPIAEGGAATGRASGSPSSSERGT